MIKNFNNILARKNGYVKANTALYHEKASFSAVCIKICFPATKP